jgi:tRNA-splicing ligase RtcB (3'-phosphate/5'-hydroxy nucleic acid ligase)
MKANSKAKQDGSKPAVMEYPWERLSPTLVEVPASAREDMRVPVRIWADDELWKQIARDRTLTQIVNVSSLPGITGTAQVMPDAHEGYGFPVGGVAAFRARDGIISPGGVGYDINCGVRLLAAEVGHGQVKNRLEPIVSDLARSIPSGTGRGSHLRFTSEDLDRILSEGCSFLAERGLATAEDLTTIEAGGALAGDPGAVSERAKQRGGGQLGSLGSGNHFVEVQKVDRIFDEAAAEALGLFKGQITVLIHTGSRGLGHQVCTDYVRAMDAVMAREGIQLPDRELACAPFGSVEGQRYFGAMCAAANFAFSNRQAITYAAREVFRRALGEEGGRLRLIYDVAHNMAKLERHGEEDLVIHRKGATRAFGPSHPETPAAYRAIGQPVLIPGSMGTASYVLVGTDAGFNLSFGSTCHGAGRAMSRTAAKKVQKGDEVRKALEDQGIIVRCASAGELAEEAPHAYKDVDRVVEVVHQAGLARKVARLVPLGVVKG